MKKVIVIVGPTGSGKTGLSIKLAQAFSAEIINGDSVQVYEGLDIGSAKIKVSEQEGVLHHLFDVAKPKDAYSVYHFQRDARQLIDHIERPMIVGGTGLYIKAALYDYEFVEKKRDHLFDEMYHNLSNAELYRLLMQFDPEVIVDQNNRRRILRALEQALHGELRSQKKKKDELLYDALILYLDLDRTILESRLRKRLEAQLEAGFIQEVIGLFEKNIKVNAIGYRELAHYLEGTLTLEEAKEEIIRASKKLAKKQKTFFKNQMHPIILDALSPTLYEDAKKLIERFLGDQHETTKNG
jgi:tRNA dimethylallyltransferase